MYGQRLCQQQHAGTHTLTQRLHTSCCQLLSSLRWDAPIVPHTCLTCALGPLGAHLTFTAAWWLFAEGLLSLTSHILSLQWGQHNVSEMTDVEEVQQWRENDHTSRAVCTGSVKMAQQGGPGFELSNMIRTHGPRGLWISRMHERKALFYSSFQPWLGHIGNQE